MQLSSRGSSRGLTKIVPGAAARPAPAWGSHPRHRPPAAAAEAPCLACSTSSAGCLGGEIYAESGMEALSRILEQEGRSGGGGGTPADTYTPRPAA